MTFDDSSSSRIWASSALGAALVAGSLVVYFFRPELGDARRVILALAATGFFFAPLSARPLSLWLWFPAVAVVAWGGRFAADGVGGIALWLACSVAGAALAIRAGSRAAHYLLPEASTEDGARLQRGIRRNLKLAFVCFAGAFVWGGMDAPLPALRAATLLASAAFFVRYLLLQAKHLSLPPQRLLSGGLVPAQRWPFLVLVVVVGSTRIADRALPGGDEGPLLMTSALLLVLAGLVFAMALVRLEWPRALIRKTSFIAGMGLAVALAAVLVELEAWGPARFTSFQTICTFALVVLPFVHGTTRLLHQYPNAATLIGPPVLSVMMAPIVAVNGWRWEVASTGFFFAFAVVMLVYHLVVTARESHAGIPYLVASLVGLATLFFADGIAWSETGSGWKLFFISLGFVLHAIDLRDRATRSRALPAGAGI